MDAVSPAAHQTLRRLDGRYVLERLSPDVDPGDGVLALVHGPDGGACMRRVTGDAEDAAVPDPWVALWNGDQAHPPEATGMLAAIVSTLAAAGVPVWTAASYDGDLILVPADQGGTASELLTRAGHRVTD